MTAGTVSSGAASAQKRFSGRHVALTGAATGIGRAIAERLADEGATLSIFARSLPRLEALAAELRQANKVSVQAFACDIRERDSVAAAFAAAAKDQGPFHDLVANAGIGGSNQDGDGDRFLDLVATNLTGSYFCARAALRHLAPGPEPRHLLFVASILARIGVGGYSGYCASKAGILGLTRALARELAPQTIEVNALCPGWVDTEMAREGLEGMAKALRVTPEEAHRIAMQEVPAGRMSKPSEIAGTVAWLLSPDSRGVTGQAIDQNGGAFML